MSDVLDRKIQPSAKAIDHIDFSLPNKSVLDNGALLYSFNDSEAEVLKIEFQFPAGSSYGFKRLDASFTNALIASGTSEMTEKEISEKIDFYGAYFEKHLGSDEASFVIYTLKKYAKEVLSIVADILNDPIFPEEELVTLRNIKKQKFNVKMEKVNFLCRREFTNALFGQDHPYGGKTEMEHYDALTREDLLTFHKGHYLSKPVVFASGNVDSDIENEINRLFGSNGHSADVNAVGFNGPAGNTGRMVIEKDGAVQSAIRKGRMLFNRKHVDFPEMQVLNTVFGGYFGSRLMSNLREDKGFTYGVGSGLASFLHEGYFFISTEVGADVTKSAEAEINFELKRIREELIPEQELDLVKNYLLGQILKSTDGVFARMSRFKTMHLFGQHEEDFQKLISGIKEAKASRLQELANEWFNEEDMLSVVAGKP